MRVSLIAVLLCSVLIIGCAEEKPAPPPPPPTNPCPLPTGYKLDPATINVARGTLSRCPEMLDNVFQSLLDIGKHSPGEDNKRCIIDLVKEMVDAGRISEKYSKSLLRKYFSPKFDALPDTRVMRLPFEVEEIKRNLRFELDLKKEGLVDCAGQREQYEAARSECARIFQLLDYLVLNEEYGG